MNGSMLIGMPRMATCGLSPFFGDEILASLIGGEVPEGTRTFKKDITDKDGNVIGKEVVRTFSSGRSNAPTALVGSKFPPCNIYTDENKKKVYEFAIAGYDPDNVSFEVNEENPSYINLILKSGMTEVEAEEKPAEDGEETKEEAKTEEKVIVYDYQKVIIKDHTCPFFVDRDRYDIEKSEVSFKNGMVKISFEPKKVAFKPKIVK